MKPHSDPASGRFRVRPMRREDHRDLLGLWAGAGIDGSDPADTFAALAVFLEHNPALSFVAVEEGRLVGALLAGEDGRAGFIHRFVLDPAGAPPEAGPLLMRRCLMNMRAQGLGVCYVLTEAGCRRVGLGHVARVGLDEAVSTLLEYAATRRCMPRECL